MTKTMKRHPFNMPFSKYLSLLSDSEKKVRLGQERFDAYKAGSLDMTEYLPPAKGSGYSSGLLAADDNAAFGRFYISVTAETDES